MDHLDEIATADLTGCQTVAEVAEREGWQDADTWALRLSAYIRDPDMPLDRQRERLAALAQVGALADQAASDMLAQNAVILEALFHRFAVLARSISASTNDQVRNSAHSERYLNAALKAQRAAMATLSALKVLRDSASTPTTPASGVLVPSGALETT